MMKQLQLISNQKPTSRSYLLYRVSTSWKCKDSFLLIQAKVMRKQWVTCMQVWDVRYSRSAEIKAIEQE
ncbi:hypothetical protein M5K25_017395 [Dendrobium thyrsiflorum]|uniref:Uncharacterized protein n=1 Tax=Dendrobium thyrsiflorum TaxID=117978 RepID=A0ABD0UUQ0_DENTH